MAWRYNRVPGELTSWLWGIFQFVELCCSLLQTSVSFFRVVLSMQVSYVCALLELPHFRRGQNFLGPLCINFSNSSLSASAFLSPTVRHWLVPLALSSELHPKCCFPHGQAEGTVQPVCQQVFLTGNKVYIQ